MNITVALMCQGLAYASEAAFERRRAALWRILSDSLAPAPAAAPVG